MDTVGVHGSEKSPMLSFVLVTRIRQVKKEDNDDRAQ